VEKLRVDNDNVQAMANRWGSLAGKLNAGAPPADVGLSCQATSVAVKTGYAATKAATAALTSRVEASAMRVTAVDNAYLTTEARSTLMIGAVGGAPTAR
jgi:hypothetical protein